MKSVCQFNDEQTKEFRQLADDCLGPTMVVYALSVLENIAYQIAQPDIDPSWIDEETKNKFDVCMAALEFFRMSETSNMRGGI